MLVVRNQTIGVELHAFECSRDAYQAVLARLKKRGAEKIITTSLHEGYVSFLYRVSTKQKPEQNGADNGIE